MRVQILGTSAAEGFPALFCECPTCRRARAAGGKNIRSRTCLRIDEDILVDLPPDILGQAHRGVFSLASIEYLLITHGHRDHFTPSELHWRDPVFAHWQERPTLRVYGVPHVGELLRGVFDEDLARQDIVFHTVHAFHAFRVGAAIITPIEANHSPEYGALNYILSHRGRDLLLAFDTGWYGEPSWSVLDGRKFDLVVMECTTGLNNDVTSGHLSVEGVRRMYAELSKRGCLRKDTRFVTLHFSHNGGLLHEDLEEEFSDMGIEVGYDGMVVELSDRL